jgi:hypothetical protein
VVSEIAVEHGETLLDRTQPERGTMDEERNLGERRERAWQRHLMTMQLVACGEDVSRENLDRLMAEQEEDVWDRNL